MEIILSIFGLVVVGNVIALVSGKIMADIASKIMDRK